MNHNLYANDFFENNSSNSSSITLKFDECGEALADTSLGSFGTDNSCAMDSLKDNPILTTASMPIPPRNNNNSTRQNMDLSDFGFDFEASQDIKKPLNEMFGNTRLGDEYLSPTLFTSNSSNGFPGNSSGGSNGGHYHHLCSGMFGSGDINNHLGSQMQIWNDIGDTGGMMTKMEPYSIEEDAVFQVDKADLIQGAELNEDPLLELSIDDFLLPQENTRFPEENPSLHSLQNVISPSNSCKISPNNYSNNSDLIHGNYLLDDHQSPVQMIQSNSMHHYGQDNLSPVGGSKLSSMIQSPSSGGPEISLYDSNHHHNLSTKYMNSSALMSSSPQTHSGSLTSHFQGLNTSVMSPRSSHALGNRKYKSPVSMSSTVSSQPSAHHKRSALHDLLRREQTPRSPDQVVLGQSVPGSSMLASGNISIGQNFRSRTSLVGNMPVNQSRLSSSAPTHLGVDQLWQRREPRPHLLSTSSMAEAGSTSSLSTGGVLSPEAQDFSQDEDSDDDSDHYEDYSSDNDSDDDGKPGKSGGKMGSKKERYFWQYNVQAKGPKGQRLVIKTEVEDPHVLNEVTDPVFSPNCSVRGIKHSGKARKGDGNDLTPNPRKLNTIGKELDKLCRVINDMTPVAELPFNARPKTRKEKNKLASRACRLKKKAQHEANKIKLFGLEHEHKRLISGINHLKTLIAALCNKPYNPESQEEIQKQIDKITKSALKVRIAGESTEFVNQILEKVKAGDPRGGLGEI